MKNKKIFFNPSSTIMILFIIAAVMQTLDHFLFNSEMTIMLVFDSIILIFGSLTIRELNKYQKSKKLGESKSGISRNLSKEYALRYTISSLSTFTLKTLIISIGNIQKFF